MVKHVFTALLLAILGAGLAETACAQGKVREERLEELPAVDTDRSYRSATHATRRANPPPLRDAAPPVAETESPPANTQSRRSGRLRIETYRNQPETPPESNEDIASPNRETAPPPRRDAVAAPRRSRDADFLPPVPTRETDSARRRAVAAPIDVPVTAVPPAMRDSRRADGRRATPPPRSTAFAACTNRCIANCEMEFEQCNGRASPAKSSCVRQLESCRPERCGCKMF